MAGDLPAHRRNSPLETFGDLAKRQTRSNPSGDVLSLGQRKRSQRSMTYGRSNPAVLRQHKVNDSMVLAEGPPYLMKRLPQLPTTPHVNPLVRGKLPSSRLRHKHHL